MNTRLVPHLASAGALIVFAALAVGSSGSSDSASAPGEARGGCKTDMDCKGDRICSGGQCVDPPAGQPGAQQEDPLPMPTPVPVPVQAPQPNVVNMPQPQPQPVRQPTPVTPPRSRAVRVSDPPGGCKQDGIIYQANGSVWGCEGGGNWCANAGPLPGGCAGAR